MNSVLEINPQENFEFLHVKGPGAEATLAEAFGNVPAGWFRYTEIPDGFLARLGVREFYIFGRPGTSVSAGLSVENVYCFPRNDAVFAIRGHRRIDFLRELCAFDFAASGGDELILANMAGVSCWFKMPATDDADLLVGSDPSYGDYMADTLNCTLAEFVSATGHEAPQSERK